MPLCVVMLLISSLGNRMKAETSDC